MGNYVRVEIKYAPSSIDQVCIPNNAIKMKLKAIAEGDLPPINLLLSGDNGNGKTTLANLIAKGVAKNHDGLIINMTVQQILAVPYFDMYLENTRTCYGNGSSPCVLIVDEVEKLKLSDAQMSQFWQIMDKHKDKLMLIFTTNDQMNVNRAIRTRSNAFHLLQPTAAEYAKTARAILNAEGIDATENVIAKYLDEYTSGPKVVRTFTYTLDDVICLNRAGYQMPKNFKKI